MRRTAVISAFAMLLFALIALSLWISNPEEAREAPRGSESETGVAVPVTSAEPEPLADAGGKASPGESVLSLPQVVLAQTPVERRDYRKLFATDVDFYWYHTVSEALSKEDLPNLYALLNDESYVQVWDRILYAITLLEAPGAAHDTIVGFAQSLDAYILSARNTEHPDRGEVSRPMAGMRKVDSIALLGINGGPQAESTLLAVLKPGGGELWTANWRAQVIGPGFRTEDEVTSKVQGAAMRGLVLLGSTEGRAQIWSEYVEVGTELAPYQETSNRWANEFKPEEHSLARKKLPYVVSALASWDYSQKYGREELVKLHGLELYYTRLIAPEFGDRYYDLAQFKR